MIFSQLLFGLSSLVLASIGTRLLMLDRLSAVVHIALAGYGALAVAEGTTLASEFGMQAYQEAAAIFLVGSTVLALASALCNLTLRTRPLGASSWDRRDLERHAFVSGAAAILALALLLVSRDDVLANWSEARFDAGPTTTLGTFLLLLACPGIVSALFARRRMLAACMGGVCLAGFVISGSRATLLAAVGLAMWLSVSRASGRWRKASLLFVATLIGLGAHVAMRQLRGLGLGGILDAYQSGDLLSALLFSEATADVSGGEAAIPRYFVFATQVSSAHDFGFLTSVVRLLLLPLPRVEGLIDKPIDVTYLLWERALLSGVFSDAVGQQTLVESYLTGSLGSLHGTVFGEYFLAGGWSALVLSSFVLALILSGIDWALGRSKRVTALAMAGPMLVGFLFVARGNSVIGLGYFFYLGVLFLILNAVLGGVRWRRAFWGSASRFNSRRTQIEGARAR